ncbi:hypothetical protein MXAN_7351 [Myxococcus xanthus DK 1622]|uniref:Lipoprotein n=1 Tax=Myxococcus xanthus (strain DK1622) TaxID=246197 RepID=Q1CVW4_MYXXD|nr:MULTISPECIES: hypothetical protein [Myxococcus]ABF87292.1 hypothetical protein MXAN_7351 [Myxococcus xanthus DK 1622]NOJ54856.1 hypothetical protein [Myxococcus xanthus]QPM79594.1 hypothetical protein I5Q59_36170 [Myxococcus xanthus]QVW68674.1 hypothetical protein JTM82_03700 [Myxococcus xanthus DZ2]QZZ54947.1 hypothetical protein MyxoNM_37925 [Myxococcus xanthus]
MSRKLGGAVGMLGVLLLSAQAGANEVVMQFRTQEDPASPADPAVCAAAPFEVNVKLGGSVYVPEHNPKDGKVVDGGGRRVGSATACVQVTDSAFPAGQQLNVYMRYNLPEGRFTARGTCTLVSNDVPAAGLVLAGCAMRLVDVPKGFVGGSVSSTSVFNPRKLPGYATGSYYTLYAYRDGHQRDASKVTEAHAAEAAARARE